jgi:hypothetical protein
MTDRPCQGPDRAFECNDCGKIEKCAALIAWEKSQSPERGSGPVFLADPDDFCRMCRGKGGAYETVTDGRMWEPCFYCGGSGAKSVRIG